MLFLINNIVIYDDRDKTLVNKKFLEPTVELTPGAVAVLLDFLIQNPNRIWSKEEIGEKAFSDGVYSGSDSNVTKSISILRRCFMDVGEDRDIISTIPMKGIVFNAEISFPEEVSLPEVNNSPFIVKKHLGIKLSIIVVVSTLIISWFYFRSNEGCILINRGGLDTLNRTNPSHLEISECGPGDVMVNGGNAIDSISIKYFLTAKCEASSDFCINEIRKAP